MLDALPYREHTPHCSVDATCVSETWSRQTLLVNSTTPWMATLASDSGRSERPWLLCEAMLPYALGNSMASKSVGMWKINLIASPFHPRYRGTLPKFLPRYKVR